MTPDQMTELAARLRELALSIGNADYAADLDCAADLIDSMAQRVPLSDEENERLRADAERYRWLRGREDGRYMTVYAFRTDVDEVCLGEELDATIDAAMAAEQSDERREG